MDVRLRAFQLHCQYPNTPRSVILRILEIEGYDIELVRIGTLSYRKHSSTNQLEKLLRKQIEKNERKE